MATGRRARALILALAAFATGGVASAQQERPLIAVLPFQAIEVSASVAQVIATLFETNLVNTDVYTVLSQNERQQILAAQEESVSDCTDEACAVEIGRLLAAEQVIIGTVATLGKKYIINAKIIDVQTSRTLGAGNISASSVEDLDVACEQLTETLVQKAIGQAAAAAAREPTKPATTPPAAEEAKPPAEPVTEPAVQKAAETTAPPAVAATAPPAVAATEPQAKPARVRPQRAAVLGGVNIPALALLSGGVILTEAGWVSKSVGAVLGARSEDAWAAYLGSSENLDDFYGAYETSHKAYTATTVGAYGLWAGGPIAAASSLFVSPQQPLGVSAGGRITFAAGLVAALAGNVLHAVGNTFAAQSRECWQSYVDGTENLDALYTQYSDAYDLYRLCSLMSFGVWAAGSLAVPAAFLIPGERSAFVPGLPAKLMVVGGTALAAAGNYAYGLAASAQSDALAAWRRYVSATENLETLYGEYEQAFARYRLGSLAAYGLWAVGGLTSAAAVLVPWGSATSTTGALRRGPQMAAKIESGPSGVAIGMEIRL